jgi:RNA-directed DNA polymerase
MEPLISMDDEFAANKSDYARKTAESPNPHSEGSARKAREHVWGAESSSAIGTESMRVDETLMEAVVEKENMLAALARVRSNKGAAGVDGMTVDELEWHLRTAWPRIKRELLHGSYQPSPVRGHEIRKPGGKGVRQLGIPTVVDRLVQQALLQVLEPLFDSDFSPRSYGFRPGRSAHQAVRQAREYVAEGRRWVVDIDLEKFFDRVNHDVLMSRVSRRIGDKRVLGLIRRFLQAGMMRDGLVRPRDEGTPQGGPLSPLLSNILLDDLDKELERRGHAFCRYADDCNIYVRTRRSGERVMASITRFLSERLRLKVNEAKSAVGRPWSRKFLGYSMTVEKSPRLRVSRESLKRFKSGVRRKLRRGRGMSLRAFILELKPSLRGWYNYFRLNEVKVVFEELDEWLRRRLRLILWRRWKKPRTIVKNLLQRGLDKARSIMSAGNGRGPWWNSGANHMNQAFPKHYFDDHGLISFLDGFQSTKNSTRTAVYGTVRTVV